MKSQAATWDPYFFIQEHRTWTQWDMGLGKLLCLTILTCQLGMRMAPVQGCWKIR